MYSFQDVDFATEILLDEVFAFDEFEQEFECSSDCRQDLRGSWRDAGGRLTFGHVVIDTNPSDDDEEES